MGHSPHNAYNRHDVGSPFGFSETTPTCRWSSKPKRRTWTDSVRTRFGYWILRFEGGNTDITHFSISCFGVQYFGILSRVNWRLTRWLEFVFALGSNNYPDSSLSPSSLPRFSFSLAEPRIPRFSFYCLKRNFSFLLFRDSSVSRSFSKVRLSRFLYSVAEARATRKSRDSFISPILITFNYLFSPLCTNLSQSHPPSPTSIPPINK